MSGAGHPGSPHRAPSRGCRCGRLRSRHDDGAGNVRRPGHPAVAASPSSSSTSRPPAAARAECGITEIGAVKVRGGEVLGEFQTLVNPGEPIPTFISVLTGITDAMVAGAPRIESALPAFLEFAAGTRARRPQRRLRHRFLKAAARAHRARRGRASRCSTPSHLARAARPPRRGAQPQALHRWPGSSAPPPRPTTGRCTTPGPPSTCCTASSSGSASSACTPSRSCSSYTSRVTPAQRRKRHLADGLPDAPGVYLFKDGDGRVLYVGTSVDIRTRVRTYFTASEHRRRMAEMVRLAESVTPIVCATTLEAEVRELRLIAEHKPRYNRRSTPPERAMWVKLTVEPLPPPVHRAGRRRRRRALHRAVRLARRPPRRRSRPSTRCSRCASALERLSATGRGRRAPWPTWAAAAPRAPAPSRSPTTPRRRRPRRRPARRRRPRPSLDSLRARMAHLADAGALRGRRTRARPARGPRARRRRARSASPAGPHPRARRGAALPPSAAGSSSACATAGWPAAPRHRAAPTRCPTSRRCGPAPRSSVPGADPARPRTPEETEKILRWLESPGVRIVELDGDLDLPGRRCGRGAGRARAARDRPARGRRLRRASADRPPEYEPVPATRDVEGSHVHAHVHVSPLRRSARARRSPRGYRDSL